MMTEREAEEKGEEENMIRGGEERGSDANSIVEK